jgi:hypothetical protein
MKGAFKILQLIIRLLLSIALLIYSGNFVQRHPHEWEGYAFATLGQFALFWLWSEGKRFFSAFSGKQTSSVARLSCLVDCAGSLILLVVSVLMLRH